MNAKINLRTALVMIVWLVLVMASPAVLPAEADDETTSEKPVEVLTSTKWKILHVAGRKSSRPLPLAADSPLTPLLDLTFTGPNPDHPFVLGNYAADADWNIVNGYLQITEGKNAALSLAHADQFELEGMMYQAGQGGWFMLVGWSDGRGYAIHNVTLRTNESGSPWFISALRGNKAIEPVGTELTKFEWPGEQPFRVKVQSGTFTLQVGQTMVFEEYPLEGYAPGAVVLGTYDTRYGPKLLRIKSLRIRAIVDQASPAGK